MTTGSTRKGGLNVGRLSAFCRELRERIEELGEATERHHGWNRSLQKAESHVRLALKNLNAIDFRSSENEELFPSLKDTLASILTQKLEGLSEEEPVEAQDSFVDGDGGDGGEAVEEGPYSHQRSEPDPASGGFHGDSACLSVAELINFLSMNQKDGMLNVVFDSEIITVWFSNGDLVHAVSNSSREGCRLGDILVREGAIDRAELEELLYRSGHREILIGELLLQHGVITKEDLVHAICVQAEEIFQRLYRQEHAHYSFKDGLPRTFEQQIRLNVTQLLLDNARRSDERAQ